MALEYFGQVYGRGNDATSGTRHYVNDFLAPINGRYREVWGVLWSCFRNGILHGSWPQAVCIRGDEQRVIAIGANPHADGEHLEPSTDYPKVNFVISAARLLMDLEASFDHGFRDWILNQSDDGILDRAAPRLLQIHPRDAARVAELGAIRSWNVSPA